MNQTASSMAKRSDLSDETQYSTEVLPDSGQSGWTARISVTPSGGDEPGTGSAEWDVHVLSISEWLDRLK